MNGVIKNLPELRLLVENLLRSHDPVKLNLYYHSLRVATLCRNFARFTQQPDDMVDRLEAAGLLHDLGLALRVDSDLINSKVGNLSPEQWNRIQEHPRISADLAATIWGDPDINEWIRYHHCRGNAATGDRGYPTPECYQLESMSVGLQILICFDIFDSTLTNRCGGGVKDAQAIAIEIENMAKLGKIGLSVARKVRFFVEKGLHTPTYSG